MTFAHPVQAGRIMSLRSRSRRNRPGHVGEGSQTDWIENQRPLIFDITPLVAHLRARLRSPSQISYSQPQL